MSDTIAGLSRKLSSARDLQSVVRTMKVLASSSLGQYETSVLALADYYRAIELGLAQCTRISDHERQDENPSARNAVSLSGAVVFGSDQGLVGQFNDAIADFAIHTLKSMPGKQKVWAVGQRVHERLLDSGLPIIGIFKVPDSVKAITSLVGRIQIEIEADRARGEYESLYLFHNRPNAGASYEPMCQQLLPLDVQWQKGLAQVLWPNRCLPEVMGRGNETLRALIREYLFITLFRACAESLASENASRLASMERADKNINELLEKLHNKFHRLRQASIDEELFDVVSGYESSQQKK